MPRRKKTAIKLTPQKQAIALVKQKPVAFILGVMVIMGLAASPLFLFQKTPANFVMNTKENKPQPTITLTQTITPTPTKEYYQLQTGESLWDVAQKFYGDPYQYTKLVELNQLASPDAVEPGMTIRIR